MDEWAENVFKIIVQNLASHPLSTPSLAPQLSNTVNDPLQTGPDRECALYQRYARVQIATSAARTASAISGITRGSCL